MGGAPADGLLQVYGGSFEVGYKRWGPPPGRGSEHRRVLCYPGWLDNAGSFDGLGPLLAADGWDVVAVDPPGCGRSSKLPPGEAYSNFMEVALGRQCLRALGWWTSELAEATRPCSDPPVVLLGHSRGGGIVLGMAATFPEITKAVVLLDSQYLCVERPDHGALRWDPEKVVRRAMENRVRQRQRRKRVFDSVEAAVAHNHANKLYPKAEVTSRNIVRRQVAQRPDGKWEYSHDNRLFGASQLLTLDREEHCDFMRHVEAPVLLTTASDSAVYAGMSKSLRESIRERRSMLRSLTEVYIPDTHHHCHSDHPASTHAAIRGFMEDAARRTTAAFAPRTRLVQPEELLEKAKAKL